MSRGVCPRVNCCGCLWVLVVLTAAAPPADAYSCHEVRTAFQLRQVGPLSRVPETPGTDVDLLICKHKGPSCCTRKMEESYQLAVRRETVHNIYSYSYELEHLLSGHSDAFQDMFQYLLSFSQGHLSSLLEGSYGSLSRQALPHVNQLFSSLSLYLRGANVSVEASVHHFFNNLFPLVYARLINPGLEGGAAAADETADCLRTIRQDVNPFGPHPAATAQELSGALGTGRRLGLALEEGLRVVNATEHAGLSRECVKGLVRMAYCPHCRGLTLIKPCVGYCQNVMRGCLASVSELDQPWRRYVGLLEQLTHAMAGHHSLELALLGVRGHVDEALLHARLHGPLITATVDKVCGLSTTEPTGMRPTSAEVVTSTATSATPLPSAAPSRAPPEQWLGQLAHLRREFLMYLQRYKSFFAALPEMLCEGENVVDDATCWSGDGVVESYTDRVVGNGVHAQRQNPEVKVRSMDPAMEEVKERLEHFNQETQQKFPRLGQTETWDDLGSGEAEEGSAAECDDEDGCQASGDGDQKSRHQDVSSEGRPTGRKLGGPQGNPSKPPSVKVIGGSAAAVWSLALLFTGLCCQWILF